MTPNDLLLERLRAEAHLWDPSPLTELLRETMSYMCRLEGFAMGLEKRLNEAKVAERCYNAGWDDMKAAAWHLLKWEGSDQLADMVDAIEKPPSGDK